jgi:hypothetical protein
MSSEQVNQLITLDGAQRSLTYVPVKNGCHFDGCPRRSTDVRGSKDQLSHVGRVSLVHVILGDISRIQIHQRSSSRKRPLSPGTAGKRSQISVSSGRRTPGCGFEIGRSSATGCPRRSIRMVAPSEAWRTSSEVRICKSRMEADLMCYIVAPLQTATTPRSCSSPKSSGRPRSEARCYSPRRWPQSGGQTDRGSI